LPVALRSVKYEHERKPAFCAAHLNAIYGLSDQAEFVKPFQVSIGNKNV